MPGRNDPCPCGSGKKYKKCCLTRERRETTEPPAPASHTAFDRATDWLVERHRAGFRASWEKESVILERPGSDPPEGVRDQGLAHWHEALLAEGVVETRGGARSVPELLLGPGGPLFTVEERRWIEAVAAAPVSLYEVVESRPGVGLVLQDLFDRRRSPVEVVERRGSGSLERWDVVGARVVDYSGEKQLSVVYSFPRHDLSSVLKRVRKKVKGAAEAEKRRLRSLAIRLEWLDRYSRPLVPRRFLDAKTGDFIMLVNDVYDVLDRAALEKRLDEQPDVIGDAGSWRRLEDPDAVMTRALWAINPRAKGRIEIFNQTVRRADESRRWAEQVLGDAVRFLTRELTDPLAAVDGDKGEGAERRTRAEDEMDPELKRELEHRFLREHYRNWADEPIPMLGDQTPRQAVRTAKGRQKVIEVLKSYETSERRRCRADGGEPFDFSFLWRMVGLDPEIGR